MRASRSGGLSLLCVALCFALSLRRVAPQPKETSNAVGDLSYNAYSSYYAEKVTAKAVQVGCTSGAPKMPVVETTIATVHQAFLSGELTCTELVEAYLQRITAYNSFINAVSIVNPDALTEAATLDTSLQAYIANGTALPYLFCVPIIAKDNYDVVGVPTTAGAIAFQDNFPFQDGTPIAKVKAQGAIILAKGTMSEWAQSATNSIGSEFGIVRNPYALDHTTGGSSGGPAASTAANLALISLGTDTGSSIRTPSAFQSLVGIRPTIGLISRKGVVPLDYYHDTCGPLGRTVTDVATVFQALVGYDPEDGQTQLAIDYNATDYGDNYTQFLKIDGLEGKKIGVWTQLATRTGYTPEILDLFEQAAIDMEDAGAQLVYNVTMKGNSLGAKDWDPNPKLANASTNDGFQEWYTGFGSDGKWEPLEGKCTGFKDALEVYMSTAGTHYREFAEIFYDGLIHPTSVSSFSSELAGAAAYYHAGDYPLPGMDLICRCTDWSNDPCQGEYARVFTQMLDDYDLDAVIYPVHGNPPPTIGDFTPDFIRNTYLSPETGTPSITVPMGFTKTPATPVGLMISGRHYDEATLFEVAYAYEQATQHRRTTALFPECTTGAAYVSYASVLLESSDVPSPAGAPATEPLPSLRKLLTEKDV